jgi:hypothetical protein
MVARAGEMGDSAEGGSAEMTREWAAGVAAADVWTCDVVSGFGFGMAMGTYQDALPVVGHGQLRHLGLLLDLDVARQSQHRLERRRNRA